jgi:hypothetical protein
MLVALLVDVVAQQPAAPFAVPSDISLPQGNNLERWHAHGLHRCLFPQPPDAN